MSDKKITTVHINKEKKTHHVVIPTEFAKNLELEHKDKVVWEEKGKKLTMEKLEL